MNPKVLAVFLHESLSEGEFSDLFYRANGKHEGESVWWDAVLMEMWVLTVSDRHNAILSGRWEEWIDPDETQN